MYIVSSNMDKLIKSIDEAILAIKQKLTNKNIEFEGSETLRQLIHLIPPVVVNLRNAVEGHTMIKFKDKRSVLISGGYKGNALGDNFILNLNNNTFADKASLVPVRQQHGISNYDDNEKQIYFFGGQGYNNNILNNVQLFSIESNQFTEKSALSSARCNLGVSPLNNNQILVSGGRTTTSSSSALSDNLIYNISSNSYTSKASLNPKRCGHKTHIINDNTVIFFGGDSGSNILNKTEIYNVNTNAFTSKANLPNYLKDHALAKIDNDRFFISAGWDNAGRQNQNYIYSISSNTFSTKSLMPNFAIQKHTAVEISGRIFIAGGNLLAGTSNKCYMYNYNKDIFYQKNQ